MQSPIPPAKPIPPTPPNMNPSSVTPAIDTPSSAATTTQPLNQSKPASATPAAEKPASVPNNLSQSAVTIPPFASYNTANNAQQETPAKSLIPPASQLPKSSAPSLGFSFFFVLILVISVVCIAVHWWKNYTSKEKTTIDYSAESSDDIVSLILSQSTPESALQTTPKNPPKKVTPTTETMPKTKGSFEVRV